MKVLIIDDAADVRLYVSALLASWGYETLVAASARQGLGLIETTQVQLVVCDWVMPEMSGPELCRTVRATDFGHYVYIVLLTARSDKGDLVEAFNAGADDFVSKPFDAQVLRARLRVGERILALEQRLSEQNRALLESQRSYEQAYAQIQCDLAAAARVQRQMLPRPNAFIAPFRCEWLFMPASQVSGDSFNLFGLTRDLLGFYLFDVSGHGIPAALLSAKLACSLVPTGASHARAVERRFSGPAAFLTQLNDQLADPDAEIESYATVIYGTLDKRSGQCEIVIAGHPRPLVLRRGGALEDIGPGGLPLGMFAGVSYEAHRLSLNAGDRFILYSDGVTECRDPGGLEFGERRFRELLRSCVTVDTSILIGSLGERLRAWRGTTTLDDDVSVMIIEGGGES